jgi:hypothetical protein
MITNPHITGTEFGQVMIYFVYVLFLACGGKVTFFNYDASFINTCMMAKEYGIKEGKDTSMKVYSDGF